MDGRHMCRPLIVASVGTSTLGPVGIGIGTGTWIVGMDYLVGPQSKL